LAPAGNDVVTGQPVHQEAEEFKNPGEAHDEEKLHNKLQLILAITSDVLLFSSIKKFGCNIKKCFTLALMFIEVPLKAVANFQVLLSLRTVTAKKKMLDIKCQCHKTFLLRYK